MNAKTNDSGVSLGGFFARRKLPPSTQDDCLDFVKSRFGELVQLAPFQGYCSFTLLVGEDRVIQFRPADLGLDMQIVAAAYDIFGDLVPKTESLGTLGNNDLLHAYSMKKLSGASLSDVRASCAVGEADGHCRQHVRDFAMLQAMSWRHRRARDQISAKGTVGSSMRWRLNLMVSTVPIRFQKLVSELRSQLPDIERLPWIMSHGDLIPSNILVSPDNSKIVGLIDWAEAEFLPFGVGFYGLEELLGDDASGRFEYYPAATQLRALFWNELLCLVPELSRDRQLLETVKAAQLLGILLWHAIAFDDGRLDRAVEEGIDDAEIQRLDKFLFDSSGPCGWRTISHPLRSSHTAIFRLVRGMARSLTRKTRIVLKIS